jgi:2-polyprenyl-3-methyl-5-hydroxy-6-metoxy-1,4-benzoquinol methylase
MTAGAPTVQLQHVRCSLCDADDAELIGRGTDHEYHSAPDTFRMVRCRRCTQVYLDPRPDAGSLDAIYPASYYAYELTKKRRAARKSSDSWLASFMSQRAEERLQTYTARVRRPSRRSYRILDIGCGDGAPLTVWRRALERGDGRSDEPAEVESCGVEMNAEAAEIARASGHRVFTARVEDAALEEGSFDLVYSSHVIAHVENPLSFLAGARRAVRPDGLVLIDTPNVDTIDFRLFGRGAWGAYHFPRHFSLYDAHTITALAGKAGLEVVEIAYEPSAIFWVWTMHALLEPRAASLAGKLFPPVDIYTRASPWNVALLTGFTLLDRTIIGATGKGAQMRVLMRPRGERVS